MTANDGSIQKVLHPTDFSVESDVAFAHALKLALTGKCKLTIVHTASNSADNAWENFPRVRRTLERWGLLPPDSPPEAIPALGLRLEKVALQESNPVRSVAHFLSKSPHDLIVLTTHQYDGLKRWTHETVAEPLAGKANAMTLFIPPNGRGFVSLENGTLGLESVLVPVHRFPGPQHAIDAAAALAEALGCRGVEATLLHVGNRSEIPAVQTPNDRGLTWRWMFREGAVEEEILRAADEYHADLIVMPTEGHRSLLDVLRGDTTEHIVRRAKCAVLAVPSHREESGDSVTRDVATGRMAI